MASLEPFSGSILSIIELRRAPKVVTQGNACGSSGTADKGVGATDPNRLDFLEQAKNQELAFFCVAPDGHFFSKVEQ